MRRLRRSLKLLLLAIYCKCLPLRLEYRVAEEVLGRYLWVILRCFATNSESNTQILDEMQHKFGEGSIWIYEILRYACHPRLFVVSHGILEEWIVQKAGGCGLLGLTLSHITTPPVKEKGPINKSMQSSKNLPKPITKYEDGHHWMMMLSAELKHRLTKAREEEPGLWPKTLSLHVSRGRFMFQAWFVRTSLWFPRSRGR